MLSIATVALARHTQQVFQTLMSPLEGVLAFHDPLHPENPPMHEWFFRSGLDHFVWVFGMFCAFAFPFLDNQLELLDSLPAAKRMPAKAILLAATLALGLWWCLTYFSLPKRSYNKVRQSRRLALAAVRRCVADVPPMRRRCAADEPPMRQPHNLTRMTYARRCIHTPRSSPSSCTSCYGTGPRVCASATCTCLLGAVRSRWRLTSCSFTSGCARQVRLRSSLVG